MTIISVVLVGTTEKQTLAPDFWAGDGKKKQNTKLPGNLKERKGTYFKLSGNNCKLLVKAVDDFGHPFLDA